jgi:hypothetical protein
VQARGTAFMPLFAKTRQQWNQSLGMTERGRERLERQAPDAAARRENARAARDEAVSALWAGVAGSMDSSSDGTSSSSESRESLCADAGEVAQRDAATPLCADAGNVAQTDAATSSDLEPWWGVPKKSDGRIHQIFDVDGHYYLVCTPTKPAGAGWTKGRGITSARRERKDFCKRCWPETATTQE